MGCFAHRELWSSSLLLSNPFAIRHGHLDWLKAGSSVLTTVSYQLHYRQERWPSTVISTDEEMDQLWTRAMNLAREALSQYKKGDASSSRRRPRFVVASSGCFGAALANGAEYTGDYGVSLAELHDFHRQKLRRILPLKPDGIAIETIPSLAECQALRDLLSDTELFGRNEESPAIYVSLACRNGCELNDGTNVKEALQVFRNVPNLHGIGFNCCDVKHLKGLLTVWIQQELERKQQSTRCLVFYPNSGETWNAADETWQAGTGCTDATEMARQLYECIQFVESQWPKDRMLPPILVGGCCRTTPQAITELSLLVDEHLDDKPSDP